MMEVETTERPMTKRRGRFEVPKPRSPLLSIGKRHAKVLRALADHPQLSFVLLSRVDSKSRQKLRRKVLHDLLAHRLIRKLEMGSNQGDVFALDKAGIKWIADNTDIPKYLIAHHARGGESTEHTLMTAAIMIALEQAIAAHPDLEFISPREIVLRAPMATRMSNTTPFKWRAPYVYQQRIRVDKSIVPDKVFGIRYIEGEDEHENLFFLEADRGTETVEPERPAIALKTSTTWLGKVLGYRATFREKMHTQCYGEHFPGFRVLAVTTPSARVTTLADATAKFTEGKMLRTFLFASYDQVMGENPVLLEWLNASGDSKPLIDLLAG